MQIPNYITERKFKSKYNKEITFVEDIKEQIFYIIKNEQSAAWNKAENKKKFLLTLKENKHLIK